MEKRAGHFPERTGRVSAGLLFGRISGVSPPAVNDEERFEELLASALEWARAQEAFILAHGFPLDERGQEDAVRAGIQEPSHVRVLVTERISPPEDLALAEASNRRGIITAASRAVAIGYGVIVRADCWGDRELLVHQLVHVAQCERCGSLGAYVREYLSDRNSCAEFTVGTMEEEARGKAREICSNPDAPEHTAVL